MRLGCDADCCSSGILGCPVASGASRYRTGCALPARPASHRRRPAYPTLPPSARCQAAGIAFGIAPHIRFQGQAGEQVHGEVVLGLGADEVGAWRELVAGERSLDAVGEAVRPAVAAGAGVLDKLVAFRDRVGPFGGLLKMGVDWGGASETWEREAMMLLAREVMPKLRQHAQAAE